MKIFYPSINVLFNNIMAQYAVIALFFIETNKGCNFVASKQKNSEEPKRETRERTMSREKG